MILLEKVPRTEAVKEDEQRPRRKSIEYEDPSIVAFGKTFDSNKDNNHYVNKHEKKVDARDTADEKRREGDKDRYREDLDKKTKNKVSCLLIISLSVVTV